MYIPFGILMSLQMVPLYFSENQVLVPILAHFPLPLRRSSHQEQGNSQMTSAAQTDHVPGLNINVRTAHAVTITQCSSKAPALPPDANVDPKQLSDSAPAQRQLPELDIDKNQWNATIQEIHNNLKSQNTRPAGLIYTDPTPSNELNQPVSPAQTNLKC